MTISIVVPCYDEAESIAAFYEELMRACSSMPIAYELIFVDDGSRDATLARIKEIAQRDAQVRFISFSRNFGKEAALLAGLEKSSGSFVVTMDADLQDPPALLQEMYNAVKDGDFDCAATRRISRKGEPPIRSFFARRFYKVMNRISDAGIVDGARDFRLMSRTMVDAILSIKERNRFSKGIFSWVGFSTKWFEYENIKRAAGETKWSLWKLMIYSLDGIIAFSTAPLLLASIAGILLFLISMCLIIFIVIRTLIRGDPVPGWPSLVCIISFVGGIQLLSVGILGQYLAKTYIETKQRPLYIVKEEK
jgi:glucosyltransferase